MEPKRNVISRILKSYRGLPAKKQYVEFFTAILTVPVLLTVIILNVSSLRKEEEPEPKKTDTPVFITVPQQDRTQPTTAPVGNSLTPTEACKKEIGPIEIANPDEGDVVTDNPVSISVSRTGSGYCAVVWSYRVNNSRWSDYDDKSIALYNPPKGQITFDLRVKSVVTGDEKVLTRKFTYDGQTDPTASSSGSLNN